MFHAGGCELKNKIFIKCWMLVIESNTNETVLLIRTGVFGLIPDMLAQNLKQCESTANQKEIRFEPY